MKWTPNQGTVYTLYNLHHGAVYPNYNLHHKDDKIQNFDSSIFSELC